MLHSPRPVLRRYMETKEEAPEFTFFYLRIGKIEREREKVEEKRERGKERDGKRD